MFKPFIKCYISNFTTELTIERNEMDNVREPWTLAPPYLPHYRKMNLFTWSIRTRIDNKQLFRNHILLRIS